MKKNNNLIKHCTCKVQRGLRFFVKSCLKNMQYLKSYFIILVLNIVFTMSLYTGFADGFVKDGEVRIDSSKVDINDVKVTKNANNDFMGTIMLKNNSDIYFPQFWCSAELFLRYENSSNSELGSNLLDKVVVKGEINPKELKKFEFKFEGINVPQNSKLAAMIRTYNRTGIPLNQKLIDLQDGKVTLALIYNQDSSYFLKNNKKISLIEGADYETSQMPNLHVAFKNNTDKNLAANAIIEIFERSYMINPNPVKTSEVKGLKFEPKSQKELIFDIPKVDVPESYIVNLKMVDDKKNVISGIVEGRYIIRGKSARIIDTGAIASADNMTVTTKMIGPSDGSQIKDGKIEIEVNSIQPISNKVIKLKKNIEDVILLKTPLEYFIDIPRKEDLNQVQIITKVLSSNKVLDKTELVYDMGKLSANFAAGLTEKNDSNSNKLEESTSSNATPTISNDRAANTSQLRKNTSDDITIPDSRLKTWLLAGAGLLILILFLIMIKGKGKK